MTDSSVLMHPVRLRIVQTLHDGSRLTTHQLHALLPDVPIATLYRQVAHLVKHDLVEVTGEQQIRGAIEKTYRLSPGLANPGAEELSSLSPEQLLTVFTVFNSGLIRDFENYVSTGEPDLFADRVNFAQADLWATTSEVDEFFQTMMSALNVLLANEPGDGRRRRKLTTVLIPQADSRAEATFAAKAQH